MAELFGLNESIECKKAEIVALKIEACGRALNHHTIGRCIKYLCSRNGFAKIKSALDPKRSLLNNPSAKLDLGDSINSVAFYVLVKGLRVESVEFNGRFSGRHNCNTFTSNSDFTFAQITEPFPGKDAIIVPIGQNFVNPILQLTKKKLE